MSSPFLDSYIRNATFAVERQIRLLETGGLAPQRGIHAMCTMFRQRGVCDLLLTGQTDGFYVNMMQSAAAFLYHLGTTADADKVTSFAKPFFDAVAGSYWDAAGEIAARSRPAWNPDYEYEDDFVYVYFLMQHAFLQGPDDTLDALLARYEAILDGAFDARLEICRALRARDDAAFHEGLVILLEQRQQNVEDLIGRGALTDEQAAWVRPFSIEGAALVKLADRLGLAAGEHYLHVPELIRGPGPFVFSKDAWRTVTYTPRRR